MLQISYSPSFHYVITTKNDRSYYGGCLAREYAWFLTWGKTKEWTISFLNCYIILREIEEINVPCVNEAQVIMICFCVKKS